VTRWLAFVTLSKTSALTRHLLGSLTLSDASVPALLVHGAHSIAGSTGAVLAVGGAAWFVHARTAAAEDGGAAPAWPAPRARGENGIDTAYRRARGRAIPRPASAANVLEKAASAGSASGRPRSGLWPLQRRPSFVHESSSAPVGREAAVERERATAAWAAEVRELNSLPIERRGSPA
jgi:hypothetical protein